VFLKCILVQKVCFIKYKSGLLHGHKTKVKHSLKYLSKLKIKKLSLIGSYVIPLVKITFEILGHVNSMNLNGYRKTNSWNKRKNNKTTGYCFFKQTLLFSWLSYHSKWCYSLFVFWMHNCLINHWIRLDKITDIDLQMRLNITPTKAINSNK